MDKKLPLTLYTAAQVRQLDKIAIEEKGIPGSTLMARAAEATFRVLTSRWPNAKKLAVVCGMGNNAGDGFVLARIAQPIGWKVTVHLVSDAEGLKGDALTAFQQLRNTEAKIAPFSAEELQNADLIVDAVFGSGLNKDVEGPWRGAIEGM